MAEKIKRLVAELKLLYLHSCHTLMVALLWSTIGGGCRICCGAGGAADAGLPAPLVGDKEVYDAACTCKFDFRSNGAERCWIALLRVWDSADCPGRLEY